MAINDIIKGAVNVQKTMPGIRAAFQDVPTSLNQLPCFVTYPSSGNLQWPRLPSIRRIEHDLNMDLYVQKGGDLSAADRTLKSYIDLVIATFDKNIQLSGACLNSGVIKYQYGKMEYAGVEYLGIRFTLRVVEMTQVVYS
jgi:hypothetical protein